MAWNLIDNVRAWDLWAGNRPTSTTDIDLAAAFTANPSLDLVITRLAGGYSGPDPSYPANYDATVKAKRAIACYPVINPSADMTAHKAMWRTAIAGRVPKVFWWDCELDCGLPAAKITTYTRTVLDWAITTWPTSVHGIYTAAWWWNSHIVHGWEHVFDLWAAQYPWEVMTSPTTGNQYTAFEPLEAKLPIGNTFTPTVPDGWKGKAQPVIWQFSEKGKQAGIPKTVDLNFVNRQWFEQVYGDTPSVPPPVPEPLVVEVRHPKGVAIKQTLV